jgi:hypothetical protein
MDPFDVLEKAFSVGKWLYDQFNVMEGNKTEARALAGRILRLSGVAYSLKTQVNQKSGSPSSPLSPAVQACLKHVEEFFVELEDMLRAYNGAAYSGGFLAKVKSAVDKTKKFFGAENWKEQLSVANSNIDTILGDLDVAIDAQGLVINIETAAVVQGIMSEVRREHSDILEMKDIMRQLLHEKKPPVVAGPRDIPIYKASDITIISTELLGEGGNSNVYLARYPHGVKEVVYKKRAYLRFVVAVKLFLFCSSSHIIPQ